VIPEELLTNRNITEAGCWEWTGTRYSDGYGRIWWQGKDLRVHRLVTHLIHGLDLGNRYDQARHKCDNPPCFNPDHLEPGAPKDNVRDAFERGRVRGWSAPRTTCAKAGHPLSGDNLYLDNHGRRICRTCRLAANKAWRLRRKAPSYAPKGRWP
jgi:hypothetical protein